MKNISLCILLLLMVDASNAQIIYRPLAFNLDDQYQKQIFIKANSVLHRGDQTLTINSNSTISRLYAVNGTSENAYSFKITTGKITDTIKGMGQQMNFNSEDPIDKNAILEKSLKRLVGRVTNVIINKIGVIRSVSNDYLLNKQDSLLTLSGLLNDKLIATNTFELICKLPPGGLLKKKDRWTDSILTSDGKEVIHYTIENVSDSTTTLNFTGTSSKNYNNMQSAFSVKYNLVTNLAGRMSVDNSSSIVKERFANITTTGYESINGILISVEKNGTILETVKKL